MTNMEPKRLYRSRKERIIGGVCGGLGKYFNIDPVFARLILAVLFLCAGIGLVAYIIAWIIVPEEPAINP
jgi:phage shock protein C